jgi:hypothetical protein
VLIGSAQIAALLPGISRSGAAMVPGLAGWKVSTHTVDNRADNGTVVGQDPNGTALPGETILLQISSGQVPPPPPPPRGSADTTGGGNGGNGGNP